MTRSANLLALLGMAKNKISNTAAFRNVQGRIIILSDLHLWGPEDPLYRALIRFMKETLKPGDNFIILGDLFDIFIGYKSVFWDKFKDLLELFRTLSQVGINIIYLEGNHDFLLSNVFKNCNNIEIMDSDFILNWDNRKFYLCHGDRINPNDIKYKVFRFLIRNSLSQVLIDLIPGMLIDNIGRSMSHASRKYSACADDETVQLFRNFACEKISHGYDFVIAGHSHYKDDIRFKFGAHEGQYCNVGFPRTDKCYLEINPGEKQINLKSWAEYIHPLRPLTSDSHT